MIWTSTNYYTYSCQIHLSAMLQEELNELFSSIVADQPEWMPALLQLNSIGHTHTSYCMVYLVMSI